MIQSLAYLMSDAAAMAPLAKTDLKWPNIQSLMQLSIDFTHISSETWNLLCTQDQGAISSASRDEWLGSSLENTEALCMILLKTGADSVSLAYYSQRDSPGRC
jgi:hypothetical protein